MSKPAILIVVVSILSGPFLVPVTAGTTAGAAVRWQPPECSAVLDPALVSKGDAAAEDRWNTAYRRGYSALEEGDLDTAQASLCEALAAARGFGPDDERWAETFDELGLLSFMRGDMARAEALQGAATAEVLLALGPPARDLPPAEQKRCSVSVGTFLSRLAIVYKRQDRAAEMEALERAPYGILGKGYLPAPVVLARLDWLISRYLLAEDLAAADWLSELRRQLQAESSER